MADNRLNLYEDVDAFRLGINGDWYYIDMPVGWEKTEFTIERDKDYHGCNYEYNDGQIELQFDISAGYSLLEDAYNKDGSDAMMQFQFGFYNTGEFYVDVDAWIDFGTYKKNRDFITVSVKRKTFNDALETGNETIVTIKDGYFNLPLHSKIIRQQTIINTGLKTGTLSANAIVRRDDKAMLYNFLDFSNATVGDLTKIAPVVGTQSANPVDNKNYLFKADGGGPFSINMSIGISVFTKVTQKPLSLGSTHQEYWYYTWFLIINRGGVLLVKEATGVRSGYTDSRFNRFENAIFTLNYSTDLLQDDEVYLFGQYAMDATGPAQDLESQFDLAYTNITMSLDGKARETTAPALMAHELGSRILSDVSGGAALLKSNFFGRTDLGYSVDGCGSLTSYTSGYLLRGFGLEARPLQITLKDWIAGLNAIYAIGMSYELQSDGKYVVRVENQAYYYANVEILVFSAIEDYQEQIDPTRIYNEVDVGYNKYPTDDVGTIDEFNTRHKYLAPTRSLKGSFTQICPQIASGDAIELTRRQQYNVTKKDTYKYDEDNFIIACVRDGALFKPERVENYTASGVIGADTVYNLRFTITRMIEHWGLWLNSSWAYKKTSDVLKNTYVAKNGHLTSQYTGIDPCESATEYTENDDLYIGDIQKGNKLFSPENITFKTKVDWQTLSLLRRCHQGADTNGRNYGYISVVDYDGNQQSGWLKSLLYNPDSELTTFVLYKKYISLDTPFDCSPYSGYTFADFEATTGLSAEIELCKFQDFA